jgi:uncharacterized protein (TIGR00290 family)
MPKQRVLLSWSSGKDSAWSLHVLRRDPEVDVVGLLTTVNAEFDRVAMHSVRRQLLELQAEAAGIDPWIIGLPHPCSNEQYESIMTAALARARGEGVEAIAFGDLFLEDIRAYRERQMAGSGFELLFPLWQQDTSSLAREMLAAGVEARVTCVDPRVLDPSFAGRRWDESFLRDLPAGVDPCGENGEFHTFVCAGPMLSHAVPVRLGDIAAREGFVFADLLPD